MSSNSSIKHRGVITDITSESVFVQLSEATNCDACQLKSRCGNVSDLPDRLSIQNEYTHIHVKDDVWVVMEESLGLKAVYYAYITPFIVLISVLFITRFWFQEWVSGLMALGMVALYYTVLYFNKSSMDSRFQMKIKKVLENE